MYVLYIVVCPFVLFLLTIVLPVLRYTDSDYPFDIFKLFLLISVFSARKLEGQLTKTVASCISNLFLKKFKRKKYKTHAHRWIDDQDIPTSEKHISNIAGETFSKIP